jgi:hypothetical protein
MFQYAFDDIHHCLIINQLETPFVFNFLITQSFGNLFGMTLPIKLESEGQQCVLLFL